MEMEVVLPLAPVDFNFDSSTCSSPYMTAPSSPQRFGNFFSAPTSPTRISAFYRELRCVSDHIATNISSSAIPFDWEEKPGTPKSRRHESQEEGNNKSKISTEDDNHGGFVGGDFEFNFSGHLERTSLSAEELFDGGKIRPLKPPPGYDSSVSSPRSPRSPKLRAKKDVDPFQVAIEETRRREFITPQNQDKEQIRRGRERSSSSSSVTHQVRKGTRSLSPLRVSEILFEHDPGSTISTGDKVSTTTTTSNGKASYLSSILSAMSFSKSYKKWKLKDLLLFRSASEGRATSKDPLANYAVLSKKEVVEDVRNSSFRSIDSGGSRATSKDPLAKYAVLSKKEVVEDVRNSSFRSIDSGGSSRRRGPPVSAHEMHYTVNRAVSEEMKRRTFLPYRQGLLGCLGFNPGVHEISRGVGSLTRV
ncbi:hypothetical protein K2173_002277 [Erythroxylum novogranatense]|uniref:Calmodulin-binding protein n=1 Tax=Erythroxylum novogranatense TaxID=1862640 RepID=A0AAV8TBS1_9ROSI|nr:hypothetical protein K2173_002277 [Erythroxylum novogranatense]